MVVLNYTGGEINAKIVYYGPGVSGKTTNLEFIHEKTPTNAKGKMVSMKTQTDRTLFFDFLPLELGEINGYRTRFLLYTVPGQVYYNATRKLVLKGVDAVVFVADSSRAKLDENLESLRNLEQNLNEHGMSLDEIPWVIQYNKRDLPDAVPLAELDSRLNPLHKPSFEAVASKGTGVYETFHGIATMVYRVLKDRLEKGELSTEVGESAPAQRGPNPVLPGAKAPAARPKPAFTGTADPEIVPRAARPHAPAIREPEPAPPAETSGAEFGFDDHVDLVLREVDPKPAAKAPSLPPAHAPRKAPEPTPSAPAKAPRRAVVGEVLEKTPARATAPADAPADENLFAAIPESTFDMELGRLPELDEASEASETAREEGPDEFVTDPMRRVEAKAAPVATAPTPAPALAPAPARAPAPPARAAAPARAPEAPRAAPAAPVASEPRVAPDAHTTQEVREVRVAVPIVLTRAQLEGGAPIRVVLDVRIVD